MNYLPSNTSERTSGSSQVVVSLIVTETTVPVSSAGNSPASELTVEEELNRRAEAMTDVLSEIMDRPVAQRFWGLNE